MEIQGRIVAVLPLRKGTSSKGAWMSQENVVETHEQYPKKLVFNVFGEDKINQFAIKQGEELIVSFDIDAHEYNGRWFNNIRAWSVQRVGNVSAQPIQGGTISKYQPEPQQTKPQQQAAPQQQGQSDDLPF